MYEDNLPWVTGVEVEVKKTKRYDDDEGGMDQGRGKERRKKKKDKNFFILKKKRYKDQLGSKLEQQPFPVNGARKLVGYFNDAK